MTANSIHPMAVVDPGAELDGVVVGPFAVIEAGVRIGAGTVVGAGAAIKRGTELGRENRVGEHAILGGDPQDLHFDPRLSSGLRIGDRNNIRELANLNRSTKEGGFTLVGDDNLIMTGAHLGHDVKMGNHVVIANYSLCAGFVEVMDRAFISGNCAIHQFARIGRFTMVAGITKLPQDAPPFSLIEGYPGRWRGINSVGLKRGGIPGKDRDRIKHYYRILFFKHDSQAAALAELEAGELCEYGRELVDFVKSSRRGIVSGPEKSAEIPDEASVD